MDIECTGDDPADPAYGVSISCNVPVGNVAEAIQSIWQCIYEGWRNNPKYDPEKPFLKIIMPCGHKIEYDTVESVPWVEVPCSCGNKAHWFIKYRLEDNSGRN